MGTAGLAADDAAGVRATEIGIAAAGAAAAGTAEAPEAPSPSRSQDGRRGGPGKRLPQPVLLTLVLALAGSLAFLLKWPGGTVPVTAPTAAPHDQRPPAPHPARRRRPAPPLRPLVAEPGRPGQADLLRSGDVPGAAGRWRSRRGPAGAQARRGRPAPLPRHRGDAGGHQDGGDQVPHRRRASGHRELRLREQPGFGPGDLPPGSRRILRRAAPGHRGPEGEREHAVGEPAGHGAATCPPAAAGRPGRFPAAADPGAARVAVAAVHRGVRGPGPGCQPRRPAAFRRPGSDR